MTISVTTSGREVTITNQANAATVVVSDGFLQRGNRGIGSWVKRRLGLGKNGKYAVTKALAADTASAATGDYTVPNVVGSTEAVATSSLISAGLVKGTVTGASDPVTAQSLAAGLNVPAGTAVNLTLTG